MTKFEGRKVLVTGGTGMVGRPLVKELITQGASVTVVSLDEPVDLDSSVEFKNLDLRYFDNCIDAVNGMDCIFHLAGVKGSPAMTAKQPASFFVPTIMFNTNILEAARRARVRNILYTSSIGVYAPKERFLEDEMWDSPPSPNDRFAGWAKRMGELQLESYRIEFESDRPICSVIRPANVYGEYDNFDPANAMVIPSLIARIESGERPLEVWGDGSAIRDFVHASDVARAAVKVVEQDIEMPVNVGSGRGASIREVVEILKNCVPNLDVVWDTSKPTGDRIRVMDTTTLQSLGHKHVVSLDDGIVATYEWYKARREEELPKRYNSFTETFNSDSLGKK